jgi:hypothetical protein
MNEYARFRIHDLSIEYFRAADLLTYLSLYLEIRTLQYVLLYLHLKTPSYEKFSKEIILGCPPQRVQNLLPSLFFGTGDFEKLICRR